MSIILLCSPFWGLLGSAGYFYFCFRSLTRMPSDVISGWSHFASGVGYSDSLLLLHVGSGLRVALFQVACSCGPFACFLQQSFWISCIAAQDSPKHKSESYQDFKRFRPLPPKLIDMDNSMVTAEGKGGWGI